MNRSQRGVAVVAGHVPMDGEEVGEVDAVVPDAPLDWRMRPLDELLG